jgi:hypothetical protein
MEGGRGRVRGWVGGGGERKGEVIQDEREKGSKT